MARTNNETTNDVTGGSVLRRDDPVYEEALCTKKHCMAQAKWWLVVRDDDNEQDVDHARCEEHSR